MTSQRQIGTPATYAEHPPAPALTGYVRCYWQVRGATPAGGVARRILPDGCADVLFELGDLGRLTGGPHAPARWVGTMTHAIVIESHGLIDTFGVRFSPGGLWALAGMPLRPLTDAQVDLADLDPLRLEWLVEPLALAGSLAARAGLLDAALIRALAHGASLPTVAKLIARISALNDTPTVASLATLSGKTIRTLERVFSEAVGVTPKQYLRYLRFERARRLLRTGRSGAEVAAETGYADQSHLIHEFRSLAGVSPSVLTHELERSVAFLQDMRGPAQVQTQP